MRGSRGTLPGGALVLAVAISCAMVDPRAEPWQPALGDWRVRLRGVDELAQTIQVVFGTPVGSVPGRPTFGSHFHEYLDEPIASLRPLATREALRCLRVCEPRVEVLRVVVELAAADDGHFTLEVRWQPSETSGLRADVQTTVVTI